VGEVPENDPAQSLKISIEDKTSSVTQAAFIKSMHKVGINRE
jgi:hypothetical protein